MRAAALYGPRDLKVGDTPLPKMRDSDVLVKIVANGVCHTDVTYFEGKVPVTYPLILGHEAAGVIAETGESVPSERKGTPVILPPLYPGCASGEQCTPCSRGKDNLCERARFLGGNRDGAYAEYVALPAEYAFAADEGLDLGTACIIADALSTPFSALSKVKDLATVETIAIYGCGGVGLGAAALATALGKEVYAIDLKEESLAIAQKLGAFPVMAHPNVHKDLRKKNIDVALECVGKGETLEQAYATVRRGGTIIDIGYSTDTLKLPAKFLMANELTLMGSWGCPTRLFPELLEFVASKRIPLGEIVTREYGLEDIRQALEDLEKGLVLGRAVIRI